MPCMLAWKLPLPDSCWASRVTLCREERWWVASCSAVLNCRLHTRQYVLLLLLLFWLLLFWLLLLAFAPRDG